MMKVPLHASAGPDASRCCMGALLDASLVEARTLSGDTFR